MTVQEREEDERVTRRTLPSTTFTLKQSNIRWLKQEARRRGMRGPSELLRDILDDLSGDDANEPEVAA